MARPRKLKPPETDSSLATTGQSWLPLFIDFIGHLRIDSKETGIGPLKPYRSQLKFLEEVCAGLDNGVRSFTCLKARQLGMSTISLAIDLFWLFIHPGTQGVLVTDDEGNRDKFRHILERYVASLPPSRRVKITKHNRNMMVFANGSVLDFLVAGTKRGRALGTSRAYNFAHVTEVAKYGDPAGLDSFLQTLSERHPNRLYIYESTANGFNHYRDMWLAAKRDIHSQKAFFIGWWANDIYRIPKNDPRFADFMAEPISEDEQELIDQVAKLYGWRVDEEQLAWYRWRAETRTIAEGMLEQELPWTEDMAFVLTGTSFFPNKNLQEDIKRVTDPKRPVMFKGFRYHLGQDFLATEFEQVRSVAETELRVWQEPAANGVYVIGCDPAYGRNDWKDRHAIEVFRCYSDVLLQVAEYATPDPETFQATWVLAHLAGAYRNAIINLEVNGPGAAVMSELRNLKQLLRTADWSKEMEARGFKDALAHARWYLYHRPDSMGAGYAYNWKTTADNKLAIMNEMRDSYTLGKLFINSLPLLHEMQGIIQDGGEIGAPGRGKDDRVFSTAFAHKAWIEWVRPSMINAGRSYQVVTAEEQHSANRPAPNVTSEIVAGWFKRQEENRSNPLRPKWMVDRGLA